MTCLRTDVATIDFNMERNDDEIWTFLTNNEQLALKIVNNIEAKQNSDCEISEIFEDEFTTPEQIRKECESITQNKD